MGDDEEEASNSENDDTEETKNVQPRSQVRKPHVNAVSRD